MKATTRCVLGVTLIAALAGPARASVPADSSHAQSIKGGESGAVFESITVEGEDRVQIDFQRPPLRINVDPQTAPGLDWNATASILDRAHIDYLAPLIAASAFGRTERISRPWLDSFRDDGAVARFHPRLEDVDKWTLAIADSRGRDVKSFSGEGSPPNEISWDGIDNAGDPVPPGLTYSYSVEATDEAGNTRNFVGEGFEVPPYAIDTGNSLALMFSVESLYEDGTLLEAASRINQLADPSTPVIIEVTAESFAQASSVADEITNALRPKLVGDPARLTATTRVEQRAAGGGSITIRAGR